MELSTRPRAVPRHHHLFQFRPSPSQFHHPRYRSSIPPWVRITLCVQPSSSSSSSSSSAIMLSLRKGTLTKESYHIFYCNRILCIQEPGPNILLATPTDRFIVAFYMLGSSSPGVTVKETCTFLVWTVEADLADGEFIYLSGDPHVLGSWDTNTAVLMSPTQHTHLWKAKVKIAPGITFKYNYFIKKDSQRFYDITWRPGPELSLLVPLLLRNNQDTEIEVRDSWMQSKTIKAPAHLLGTWIEEMYLPVQSKSPPSARDEDQMTNSQGSGSLKSIPLLTHLTVEDKSYGSNGNILFSIFSTGSDFKSMASERNQPMEEPWLMLQSFSLLSVSENREVPTVFQSTPKLQDETGEVEVLDQNQQLTDKLLSEAASNSLSSIDSVSTVILINSSICTMQRIAVLEDSKLVELLLEPVKKDVLCDSLYLGVVTKLVPHMGGAFVNIGSKRPSLMDIKHSREPFAFPPFRRKSKERNVYGSTLGALDEHSAVNETEHTSQDLVIDDLTEVDFRDDPMQLMHDDDEEEDQDAEDDYDGLEVIKENIDVNADEVINTLRPVELDYSHESQSNLQDVKDPKQGGMHESKWDRVQKGTKIIVQVVKEGLGSKGPTLTAYPKLRSRFWVLLTCCDRIGVSKKIAGVERTRLKVIAKTLQPKGFGLTVRTVASGHSLEELQKDLDSLLSTWKNIMEHAKSATLAADEGVEGAIPVILHRAMGQTLAIVQDYFNDKVKSMVVDSPRSYHEVTNYLQEIAPDLCDRVQLYDKGVPLFDEFKIEEEINSILSKRVPLTNGGSLVIEQTEALVSVDVNGGHVMLGQGTSQEKAILEVNLAAAKQIARELRLRDIGGIIVVDFIDMIDDTNKRLVYDEIKKAVERDRSLVKVSELSRHGLMEITRKRVRPSVTFMISEPCPCCHATGRVEALETSFAKIEQDICRLLAMMGKKPDPENPKSWPKFILRVDRFMCNYLTSGKRTRLAILSSSLRVWILLKVASNFTRGAFEMKQLTDEKTNTNQTQVAIPMFRQSDAADFSPGRKITLFPIKKWKTSGK